MKKWRAVVIYPSRSVEQRALDGYEELLETGLILRIYLDELPNLDTVSKNVGLFKLLVASETKAPNIAKALMQNATLTQVDLIEQIVSYKFPKLTREEVKSMLCIQEELLKDIQFYKDIYNEAREAIYEQAKKEGLKAGLEEGFAKGINKGEIEGKLSTVPIFRKLGLSDEAIAEALKLPIESIKSVR